MFVNPIAWFRALPILALTCVAGTAAAYPDYPELLPNSAGCVTCHDNIGGGEECAPGTEPCLNPFGRAFRSAGFAWSPALAAPDTDGDGCSNGEELGDPVGYVHAGGRWLGAASGRRLLRALSWARRLRLRAESMFQARGILLPSRGPRAFALQLRMSRRRPGRADLHDSGRSDRADGSRLDHVHRAGRGGGTTRYVRRRRGGRDPGIPTRLRWRHLEDRGRPPRRHRRLQRPQHAAGASVRNGDHRAHSCEPALGARGIGARGRLDPRFVRAQSGRRTFGHDLR